MLVVAWKLKCKVMGEISLDEWMGGMTELECDNSAKLQAKLPSLSAELKTAPASMKHLFRYGARFSASTIHWRMPLVPTHARLKRTSV
jgi:hypothetical protein